MSVWETSAEPKVFERELPLPGSEVLDKCNAYGWRGIVIKHPGV
jgi:hypothetical protein